MGYFVEEVSSCLPVLVVNFGLVLEFCFRFSSPHLETRNYLHTLMWDEIIRNVTEYYNDNVKVVLVILWVDEF